VGAGVREVETFGRRLAETQGVSGDARVDWVSYGRAAQDALRRGHGIPLVGPFVTAQRPSDITDARLRPGPTPPRPVPIRTPPLLSNQLSARRRDLLPRLSDPLRADRRILSTAWCLRVGTGTSWRIAVVLLTLGLAGVGVQLVDTALLVATAGILLPKVVRDPGIFLLRYSLLSVLVVRVLATNSFGYVLAAALMSAPVSAILAARRWRLS